MGYIKNDFLLKSEYSKELYEQCKDLPIIDYHCHLEAKDIYEDREFKDITQIWLGGDHYKWRLMRAMGIDEHFITGDAPAIEKFKAFAYTMENIIGSPVHHFTQLELKKYFGIEELLTSENALEIFELCNKTIAQKRMSPRYFIKESKVEFICTTDDPTSTLEYHRLLKDSGYPVKVVPGFRPDRAYHADPEVFSKFICDLNIVSQSEIIDYSSFMKVMEQRVKVFSELGSNVSDHGLIKMVYHECSDEQIEAIFKKRLKKEKISTFELEQLQSRILLDLAKFYKKYNFVLQIHFGAIRNNNKALFKELGADCGIDSICDQEELAFALNGFLNALLESACLGKTIIYNLNPIYNDLIATTIANFQAYSKVRSKIQLGAGWWFNDTKRGMENQMRALCDNGILMNFVGMLTDSRSYLSYARHDYFRRVLSEFCANMIARDEFPNDQKILKKLMLNLSYYNAKEYFLL